LQAVLHDDDSIVIGYDRTRGEPRGRPLRVVNGDPQSPAAPGDCIDCDRCVSVCPTGIDIRNGLQMECIACAQCIDACDEAMDKIHRPRGLVRYDSQRKFAGGRARLLRPRPIIYTVLFLVATTVAFASTTSVRAPLALSVLPARGATFVIDHGVIRNHLEVVLTNKLARPLALDVTARGPHGARLVLPFAHVDLGVGEARRFPLFVEWRRRDAPAEATVTVDVTDSSEAVRVAETARLLAPP
jgi:cytochrome c oxidase accessory protein FixG